MTKMRNLVAVLMLAAVLPAVMLGATREYDVDLVWNAHGWAYGDEGHGLEQTFVCTADSLLWAEFFVGAANSGGEYYFEVLNGTQQCYDGRVAAAPESAYRYVRAELSPTGPPLIKGKEYVLRITHSDGDSINYYANDLDAYQYGEIEVPGKVVPDVWDLACRIEGVNRAVSSKSFGLWVANMPQEFGSLQNAVLDSMESLGVGFYQFCWGLNWHETAPGQWSFWASEVRGSALSLQDPTDADCDLSAVREIGERP